MSSTEKKAACVAPCCTYITRNGPINGAVPCNISLNGCAAYLSIVTLPLMTLCPFFGLMM